MMNSKRKLKGWKWSGLLAILICALMVNPSKSAEKAFETTDYKETYIYDTSRLEIKKRNSKTLSKIENTRCLNKIQQPVLKNYFIQPASQKKYLLHQVLKVFDEVNSECLVITYPKNKSFIV